MPNKDWPVNELGSLAEFKSGGTPSKEDPDNWGGEMPWVSAKDMKRQFLVGSELHLSKQGSLKAKIAPKHSILILVRGMTLLKDVPICLATREVAFNQDIKALVAKENIDPLYLSYALLARKNEIQSCVDTAGHGTGRLETERLRTLPIITPPFGEQQRIARILRVWDRAIEAVENLIANSALQKKALMQRLLTGSQRFPDWAGTPRTVVALKQLCTVRRGASPRPIDDPKWFSEKGRGWVRIKDVTDSESEFLESATQYLSPLGVAASVSVDPGELIMSICATIGVPKIVGIPVCIHDGFVVFRNVSPDLDREFLYYLLELKTRQLANSGQPGTQKNLNTTIVGDIQVPSLLRDEQKRVVATLKAADLRIRKEAAWLAQLQSQKAALMQELLTEKRKVWLESSAAPVAANG